MLLIVHSFLLLYSFPQFISLPLMDVWVVSLGAVIKRGAINIFEHVFGESVTHLC